MMVVHANLRRRSAAALLARMMTYLVAVTATDVPYPGPWWSWSPAQCMATSPPAHPYRIRDRLALRRGWLGGTVRQAYRLLSNTGPSAQARSSLNAAPISAR